MAQSMIRKAAVKVLGKKKKILFVAADAGLRPRIGQIFRAIRTIGGKYRFTMIELSFLDISDAYLATREEELISNITTAFKNTEIVLLNGVDLYSKDAGYYERILIFLAQAAKYKKPVILMDAVTDGKTELDEDCLFLRDSVYGYLSCIREVWPARNGKSYADADKKDAERSSGKAQTDSVAAKDLPEIMSVRETAEIIDRAISLKERRAIFLGHAIPAEYDKKKQEPVQDKVVFLQPRQGLNLSCRYIYRKLEKEYPYQLVLCELKRGDVPYTEHYLNAVRFIREMATAKAVFMHESNPYLSHVNVRPETKVIQLWHGCGIIKKIGLSTADQTGYKSSKTYEEYPEYNKYDLVTLPSEEEKWIFEEFMGKAPGDPSLQAIGVSRTDEFFDEEYLSECYEKIHRIVPESQHKKIILYAPTYRGVDPNRTAPDKLDISAFAKQLADDYVLIIKQHQTVKECPAIPDPCKNSFAYDLTRGKGININELMAVADICISDYSSVVFEYALFERPIIFFTYDWEEYNDERGMYYTLEELTSCGPVFKTNEEMIDYIVHINSRFDKKKVTDFRKKYMAACDGHATERIIAFMEGEVPAKGENES